MSPIVSLILCVVGTCIQAVVSTEVPSVSSDKYICPPWYNYNPTNGRCMCTVSTNLGVRCSKNGVIVTPGYCTTYEEESGLFLGACRYFQPDGLNFTSDGYLLPNNISELNDYMCGPMNRKNRLCSDCIDGFGPSFTSIGFECSNCTDRLYGVPLYLLVDLAPITLMYLIIMVFHVHLTSPPMTGYILYSQTVVFNVIYYRRPPIGYIVLKPDQLTSMGIKTILALYGIWNLDSIRYLLPPFCISGKLGTAHIALLEYVSGLYPLYLIFLTWVCIELHGQNFKPVVLLWRPINRFLVKLGKSCDSRPDLIGVFASFFFISFTKLTRQSMMVFSCEPLIGKGGKVTQAVAMMNPRTECYSMQHLLYGIPALLVFLFCIILPPALFFLHSSQRFRMCLSKFCLSGRCHAGLNIFMEKYNSSCRDGLNGGRDMRIFAGFYFILGALIVAYDFLRIDLWKISLAFWTYQTFLFTLAALLIAFVQPYKKTYINVFEVLLLLHSAVVCHLLSEEQKSINQTWLFVVCVLPFMGFASFVILMLINRLIRRVINFFKCQMCCKKISGSDTPGCMNDLSTSQPLIASGCPTSTTVDIANYGTIN